MFLVPQAEVARQLRPHVLVNAKGNTLDDHHGTTTWRVAVLKTTLLKKLVTFINFSYGSLEELAKVGGAFMIVCSQYTRTHQSTCTTTGSPTLDPA